MILLNGKHGKLPVTSNHAENEAPACASGLKNEATRSLPSPERHLCYQPPVPPCQGQLVWESGGWVSQEGLVDGGKLIRKLAQNQRGFELDL